MRAIDCNFADSKEAGNAIGLTYSPYRLEFVKIKELCSMMFF